VPVFVFGVVEPSLRSREELAFGGGHLIEKKLRAAVAYFDPPRPGFALFVGALAFEIYSIQRGDAFRDDGREVLVYPASASAMDASSSRWSATRSLIESSPSAATIGRAAGSRRSQRSPSPPTFFAEDS